MEKVCDVSDVPEGTMRGFTVGFKYILLANVDGNFYAMDAVCAHHGGYLPIGKLEKNIVTCPVHGSEYDVTTGKLVKDVPWIVKSTTGGGARDLNSYQVSVEGDSVLLNFKNIGE